MKRCFYTIVVMTLVFLAALALDACSAGPQISDNGTFLQKAEDNQPADKESVGSQDVWGRIKSISGDILEIEPLDTPAFPYIDENGEIPLASVDIEAFKKQVVKDGGEIASDDGTTMIIVFNPDGNTGSDSEARAVKNVFTDDGKDIGIVIYGSKKDLIKYTGETVEITLTPDTGFFGFVEQNSRSYFADFKDSSYLQVNDVVSISCNGDGTITMVKEPMEG